MQEKLVLLISAEILVACIIHWWLLSIMWLILWVMTQCVCVCVCVCAWVKSLEKIILCFMPHPILLVLNEIHLNQTNACVIYCWLLPIMRLMDSVCVCVCVCVWVREGERERERVLITLCHTQSFSLQWNAFKPNQALCHCCLLSIMWLMDCDSVCVCVYVCVCVCMSVCEGEREF